MWLLNTCAGELVEFLSDDDIPPYAILSHTWGQGEVTFKDWQSLPWAEVIVKKGYEKIKYSCQQAAKDGLQWVWIDTCCIDKNSSSELSEAINSMYRWYSNSIICYAYLSDVSRRVSPAAMEEELSQSRWFTRGWTLQELIAPSSLVFYSQGWNRLGTKEDLYGPISAITGIELAFLSGKARLESASVSKRMSWAAGRTTSRSEDIAYCLLGIFDINMPLLYGEGKKSFRRLQLEIMKTYPLDQTLFAWGELVNGPHPMAYDEPDALHDYQPPIWNEKSAHSKSLGLLAESPEDFRFSGSFEPHGALAQYFYNRRDITSPLPVNMGKGIRIHASVLSLRTVHHWKVPQVAQVRVGMIARLLCTDSRLPPGRVLALPLQEWGHAAWSRSPQLITATQPSQMLAEKSNNTSLYVEPQTDRPVAHGDFFIRYSSFRSWKYRPGYSEIEYLPNERRAYVRGKVHGTRLLDLTYEFENRAGMRPGEQLGCTFSFGRLPQDGGLGRVTVDFILLTFGGTMPSVVVHGQTWYRHPAHDSPSLSDHLMALPADSCVMSQTPLPDIRIGVQRMPLQEEGQFVDVIDVVEHRWPSTSPPAATPATVSEGDDRSKRELLSSKDPPRRSKRRKISELS